MNASTHKAQRKFHLRQNRERQKLLTLVFSGLLLMLFSLPALAQNNTRIKGRVTGENGQPVTRATIAVKGSTAGATADDNGNYEITAPTNGTLIVSAVGFTPQEVVINNRTTVDVVLVSLEKTESEVIVTGYGTTRKKDVTGSIASISGSTLKEVPSTDVVSQMKGRIAGVSIVSNSGSVGSIPQIRIRGNRTLTTSQGSSDALDGPLFVVDGIPYGGLADLNPDDIVSMDILKDASATAIYGSRGAGGVILITTKRGKTGKPVVSYDGYYSMTTIMDEYNVFNGPEYAQFKADAATYNRSSLTSPGTSSYLLTQPEKDALAAGISTDWQKLIFKNGYTTSQQLGVQGGTDVTQYSMGAGFFRESGIIPNQRFDRTNLRLTLDQKIGKHVKIGVTSLNTVSYTNNPGGGGVPGGLVRLTPLAAPYNSDGTVNLTPAAGSIDAAQISPLTLITKASSILSRTRSLRTFNSAYAEVKIIEGLRYRFNAGLNYSQSAFNGYSGPLTYVNTATVQSSSNANVSNTEYWNYNLQHLLYYDKVIASKHRIGFTGLFEITKDHAQGSSMSVTGVPADYIGSGNFALASGTPTASGTFTEQGLVSYMGRLNYTYNNRYMLTATVRRDGSSTLSPGHQWFTYPAIGLGWTVTEESFMKDVSFISNLKLRGGWGISGNRNVGPYQTLGALSAGYYNFGTGTAGQQLAYTVTSLPATGLGWQSTSQVDVGLEFGILKNRITGTVDYYHQKTKDILLSVNLPQSNGAGSTLKNLGKTEGKGLEIAISGDVIRNDKGFNWSVDLTYFYNREKITQLTTPSEKSIPGNGWFVGQPLTVIFDYKKLGIWQTDDSVKGLIAQQVSPVQYPGQIRVQDVDGDHKITAADRQILGNFQPKWEGGITNRFSYKGFDLSVVVYARMGMKVVVPYLTGNSTGSGGFAFFNQSRVNQIKVNYWTRTNATNDFPAPDAGSAVAYFGSVLGYQDGSFVKCRSINIGYTITNKVLHKTGISAARVYVNVTNPFIFYSPFVKAGFGPDPEGNAYNTTQLAPTGTSDPGAPTRQISVDLNNPPVRQFTFGLNLKF
jgi:TonB-linked SusC/RagA family outer membrane protein